MNFIPAVATIALAYGNYDYNNRLGKKDKENVEDKGPSPFNQILWRVAVIAIDTILGGPVGGIIGVSIAACDAITGGKLTEATNKIFNGNIIAGAKDIASAIAFDIPQSLFRGALNLIKKMGSKTTEQKQNSPATPGETGQQQSSSIINLNPAIQAQAVKEGAPLAKAATPNEEATEKANTGTKPILGNFTRRKVAEDAQKGQEQSAARE